jgi:transposase
MITVEEREAIRRAYYLEGKSKRQIAREHSHSRKTVDKAVDNQPPQPYLPLLEQRPGAFD